MPHPRRVVDHHHSAPSLKKTENAVRPDRRQFSSPATFFSNAMRRARRNIGYSYVPLIPPRAGK